MGLSLRSLYLVSQYIPLSDAEAQAIAYHDGMYVPAGRPVGHREEPLLLFPRGFLMLSGSSNTGIQNLRMRDWIKDENIYIQ